jgi:hypothetical protein
MARRCKLESAKFERRNGVSHRQEKPQDAPEVRSGDSADRTRRAQLPEETLLPGKIVTSFCFGTQLYDYIHDNPF